MSNEISQSDNNKQRARDTAVSINPPKCDVLFPPPQSFLHHREYKSTITLLLGCFDEVKITEQTLGTMNCFFPILFFKAHDSNRFFLIERTGVPAIPET